MRSGLQILTCATHVALGLRIREEPKVVWNPSQVCITCHARKKFCTGKHILPRIF
jgi:hypothetical protein